MAIEIGGYEALAIAITTRAAEDYRKAFKQFIKRGEKPYEMYSIERFFLSNYGDAICFGYGNVILEKLQKECLEDARIKTKPYFSPQRMSGWK